MSGEFILVVDDDRKNLEIVHALLTHAGYDVEVTSEGEDALERIAETPPDLIILDVFMPFMSGMEVADALKGGARTRAIPLLAMSAYHEFEKGAARRDLAVDDFLRKPVDKEELLKKVRDLLST